MSELDQIFLVLAAIYLVECVGWMKPGSVVFTRWISWRAGEGFLANRHGQFRFSNPLPGWGLSVVARPWPVAISPEGVVFWHAGRTLGFAEMESVQAVEKALVINGNREWESDSALGTQFVCELLLRVKGVPEMERGDLIRGFLFPRGASPVAKRFELFLNKTTGLRVWNVLLFLWLFGATPLLVSRFGVASVIVLVVLMVLLLGVLTAIAFARLHREFHPRDRQGRKLLLITMCLAPPAAIRAADHLARDLFFDREPVEVALGLLSGRDRVEFARNEWRRQKFRPVTPVTDARREAIENWFDRERLRVLEDFLTRERIGMETLAEPPEQNPGSIGYCPGCESQYTEERAACVDCGGVKLVRF